MAGRILIPRRLACRPLLGYTILTSSQEQRTCAQDDPRPVYSSLLLSIALEETPPGICGVGVKSRFPSQKLASTLEVGFCS